MAEREYLDVNIMECINYLRMIADDEDESNNDSESEGDLLILQSGK